MQAHKMDFLLLYWSIVICVTSLKFLLLASYKSTDFEVHRNWLAITHSLPIEKWYSENTSQWTLDYPPFFAWFEYLMSFVAAYFDPSMLQISRGKYESYATLVFQRTSVIVTDLVYAVAVYKVCRLVKGSKFFNTDVWSSHKFILSMLLLTNAGLLTVDHIHFQYNGFLFGFLLLSIVAVFEQNYLQAALWFTVLLNLKQIFLYAAPAYFVFLLRSYCFKIGLDRRVNFSNFSFENLTKLGVVVLSVFGLSFGPFIYNGQVGQVLTRLFPFKRGLTHAFWAPNFWALYNCADKFLAVAGSKFNLIDVGNSSMSTRGLVHEYKHAVLPSIAPSVTIALSVLSMLPSLYTLWKRPSNPTEFLRTLILCTLGSFMFGWHVHEKAILMVILPFCLLALFREADAKTYLLLSTIGHYSITPLLFRPAETPTKLLMVLLYFSYSLYSFKLIYGSTSRPFVQPTFHAIYLAVLPLVQLYVSVIHHLLGLNKSLPFLPLMLISVYCALGVTYVWVQQNWISWKGPDTKRSYGDYAPTKRASAERRVR